MLKLIIHISKGFSLMGVVLTVLLSCGITYAQSEYAGRGGGGAYNSVYRIECPDQNKAGTAFGHKSGRIITSEHVIQGCDIKYLRVISSTGVITGVNSLVMDAAYDLALLIPTIDDFVKVPLDITSESAFIVGAQVSTWGFPEGYQNLMPLLTVGYLAGSDEDKSNPGIVVKKWIVNGAFNRGNSGGPVLETKTGKVFAVISGKLAPMPKDLENSLHKIEKEGSLEGQTIAKILNHVGKQTQLVIGYATLTEDLRRFLKDNGVEP
jgi:hypothetical protein